MHSQGVLTEQLGSEDLDQMVQAAIQDEVVQALLKTGNPVTQESYLALAHPEDEPTMPEVVAGLPAFFHHLPPAETSSTPLSDKLSEKYLVRTDSTPLTLSFPEAGQLLQPK